MTTLIVALYIICALCGGAWIHIYKKDQKMYSLLFAVFWMALSFLCAIILIKGI
jgi:hypothetical protein